MNATFFAQFMRWVREIKIRLEDDSPENVAGTIKKLLGDHPSMQHLIWDGKRSMQKRKIHDSLILDDTAMLRQERKSKDVDAIKKWSEKAVERLNDNKKITRNMHKELEKRRKEPLISQRIYQRLKRFLVSRKLIAALMLSLKQMCTRLNKNMNIIQYCRQIQICSTTWYLYFWSQLFGE